jgi:hypothetical protein
MQRNFETALSLLESQSSVSTDTILMIKNLYQNLQASHARPASVCYSRPVVIKSDLEPKSPSGENSSDTSKVTEKKFKPASSKRQQLTSLEAAEIFELRPRSKTGKALRRGSMLLCKTIAPKYGVSPKTIRDIWRGRTWLHATEHLWTEEDKKQKSSNGSITPYSQIAEPNDADSESPRSNADLLSMRPLTDSNTCNTQLRVMHEMQMRGQRFDHHQASQGCLPASHPCHLAATPSTNPWASIALQQLALQGMQGCAAHNLATAAPNPPVFDPALLRQLCGPSGVGAGAGQFLSPGLAAGLAFAPLQPPFAAGAGFGGFARGPWGV